MNNKVCIVGLGYVGLPLAALIAERTSFEVCGLDINKARIEQLSRGICPEDHEISPNLLSKIKFSDNESMLSDVDWIIICVPTPVHEDHLPDFGPLISALKTSSKYLKKGQTVVIESTINPGVCEELLIPILEESGLKAGVDFDLAHCPERINPGDKVWKLENIPRNIGATSSYGLKRTAEFYRTFLMAEVNELSSLKAAEASKIIENTFRDINIAYVNELAKVFDLMDLDLLEVINAAKNKPFAFMAHYPGCGVGGHCIPVDPYYLIESGRKIGFDHVFLKAARKINNSMPAYTVELLEKYLPSSAQGLKVLVLGVSYKAGISDYRESPALKVVEILAEKGFDVKKFDPMVPQLSDFQNLDEALEYSPYLILTADHSEFKAITPQLLKQKGITVIIDGKNCLDKQAIKNLGIIYKGIGH